MGLNGAQTLVMKKAYHMGGVQFLLALFSPPPPKKKASDLEFPPQNGASCKFFYEPCSNF